MYQIQFSFNWLTVTSMAQRSKTAHPICPCDMPAGASTKNHHRKFARALPSTGVADCCAKGWQSAIAGQGRKFTLRTTESIAMTLGILGIVQSPCGSFLN